MNSAQVLKTISYVCDEKQIVYFHSAIMITDKVVQNKLDTLPLTISSIGHLEMISRTHKAQIIGVVYDENSIENTGKNKDMKAV